MSITFRIGSGANELVGSFSLYDQLSTSNQGTSNQDILHRQGTSDQAQINLLWTH